METVERVHSPVMNLFSPEKWRVSLLLLPAFLALFSKGYGQTPTPLPSPSPTPTSTEQTIYVPFEKLEDVFENQERGVFLPYREFLELWNKVNLPDKIKTAEPPVDGVLAAGHYSGRVTDKTAVITASLQMEAFKDGWSRVELGGDPNLQIADVKSTASLDFRDGKYAVIFPAKGKYTLDATLQLPVTNSNGWNKLEIELPKTAASQFEVTIPGSNLDVTVTPTGAYTTSEQPDGTTKVAVYFGPSQKISIQWKNRAAATALQPLLYSTATNLITASTGSLTTKTRLEYRTLRAPVSQFSVLVQKEDQVVDVAGSNIRDWRIEPAGDKQRVIATLTEPARPGGDITIVEIEVERAMPKLPAKLPLPLISAENVERQDGTISLFAATGLRIEPLDLQGLIQQSAMNDVSSAGVFRYSRAAYSGSLLVTEAQPLIDVSSQTLVTIDTESKKLEAFFEYNIRQAGIFEARVIVPEGFSDVEAAGDLVENSSVTGNQLTIRFKQRVTGNVAFTVTGEASRKKPDEPISAAVFQFPGVARHDAKIGLAVHTGLKATTQDMGDLRTENVQNITAVQPKNPDITPLILGFRYRQAENESLPKTATVVFEPRQPRVSVQVLAFSDLRESLVRTVWVLHYRIEYAGVNTLRFSVPAPIADDIQIEGDNIQQRTRHPEKDGAVIWTITLQDKVLGATELRLTLDRPQTNLQQGAAESISLPEIKPLDVFRETGQIAILKAGNIEITETKPIGLELIDPQELDENIPREGIYLAYKYAAHPVALDLNVAKNLYLDVPEALATYAVLTSVIAENRAETTEVIYWLRNNSQQFISVQLPQGGRMLSDAFVDGEAQQPSQRPDKNEVLIRLPANANAENAKREFSVRFIYEVPSKKPDSGLWPRGTIRTMPPVLKGVDVVQTKWTLYLPPGFRYIKLDGPMKEFAGRWGWDRFRHFADSFVPQFGPQPVRLPAIASNEPPELPAAKGGGFDFQIPKEGTAVTLRRMDAPAEIVTHYRSKAYANVIEAVLFIVAIWGGVRLVNRERLARFGYALGVGGGALVIAGAVAPRAAGMWTAIYLGVLVAIGVWVAAAAWRLPSRIRRWPKKVEAEG